MLKNINIGQSAAKLEREGSTTIPKGSREKSPEMESAQLGKDIVCA